MADDYKRKRKSTASDEIMREMQDRFEESLDGSSFNRNDAEEDIKFSRLGDQWPDKVKEQREREGRPCLTINRLPSFVRQVVNDARQNKPGIHVAPVDNGADENTAQVLGGLVRSIERASKADVAYDTAIDHAVSGGFGFFRIEIDYCHSMSFDMECRIRRVPNPLMVYWDVSSTRFDASDWDYAFVSEMLPEEQFEVQYPKAEKVDWEGYDTRDSVSNWLEEDQIRIAEYWKREEHEHTILLLSNGMVVRESALDDSTEEGQFARAFLDANGVTVNRERKAKYHKVTRRVVNGVEVLEEDEWPGESIPIIPVWGEEIIIEGRRHFRSLVRDAIDPQRMFNFWRSATTELVALAPRAPWVGPEGFVPDGQEEKWETANTRSHAYLEFDANAAMPPQRQPFAGIPAGALQEALNAADDMKAIIGIYDPSLGARSNETSGRAITARQRESDTSNFHFIDNLNRAIAYAGQVLLEVIPHVYGARQAIRILGVDMKEEVIQLVTQDAPPAFGQERKGADGAPLYDLSVGKYDVTVKAGPSYSTQREETREVLIEIMRQVPGAAAVLGDIVLDHLDFVGADKVSARLAALLPDAVKAMEAGALEGGDIPDSVKPLIMQSRAQIQQLQEQLAMAMDEGRKEEVKLIAEQKRHEDKMTLDAEKIELDRQRIAIEEQRLNRDQAQDAQREAAALSLQAEKIRVDAEKAAAANATTLEAARIQAETRIATTQMAQGPAVSLNLAEGTEQAMQAMNADVAAALGQISDALSTLAAPKEMVVQTSTGKTLKGISAPVGTMQ